LPTIAERQKSQKNTRELVTLEYRSEKDFGKSPRGAGMKRYLDARGLRVLAALDAVATKVGTTPAQVALAWLIARPGITAPIASATSLAQLDEIMGAARLKLDADDIKEPSQRVKSTKSSGVLANNGE
jgi:aryl-alcohol dehydrogenase-like predicted oxidoreductase